MGSAVWGNFLDVFNVFFVFITSTGKTTGSQFIFFVCASFELLLLFKKKEFLCY